MPQFNLFPINTLNNAHLHNSSWPANVSFNVSVLVKSVSLNLDINYPLTLAAHSVTYESEMERKKHLRKLVKRKGKLYTKDWLFDLSKGNILLKCIDYMRISDRKLCLYVK